MGKPQKTTSWDRIMPYQGDNLISLEVTTHPKWWQFWKKPETKHVLYKVTSTNTSGAA